MDPIFYNKDGSLTKYALLCGYVQKKGNTQLYQEHTCYHVVAEVDGKFRRQSTHSLTEARKFFRTLGK
jgi:hypothetical protein